jgi:TatD DNase family protein
MNRFLIDTHCHLNMGNLHEELDSVIDRAQKNDVRFLHTICTKIEEFPQILSIAESSNNIYCSVGVHPDNCKGNPVSTEKLIELSKHPKVISFGETGLDYYHEGFNKEYQKKSFINHINASKSEKLPVIVHTRDAGTDTIDILTSESKSHEFPAIIHCFTESYDFAKKAIDLGFYISIAGIVTFKNAKELQDTVSKLPLDRILIETDAPFLAPMPYRGKRNEPSYVKHTAEFLSHLFSKKYDEIADITTKNALSLFKKLQHRWD